MLSKSGFKPVLALVVLLITALACGFGGEDPTPTPEPANTAVPATEEPTAEPTEAPEPTATADPTAGFESFTSDESGVTVGYPADWAIEDLFFVSLASSEALLEDTEGMTEGGVMLIFTAPSSDYESSDPLEIINQAAGDITGEDPDATVSEPESLSINGQEAARVTVDTVADDGTPLQALVYVIVSGDRVATVFGATPDASEAEYLPVIEAIAGTVEVFEPVVAAEPETEPETEVVVEPPVEQVEIRQWASSAVASSEYSNPGWAAIQATGERDTVECGDYSTAWASSASDGFDTLELTYDIPVNPTQVNIAQTHSPNQVVLVELLDTNGVYHEVYSGEPSIVDCPYDMVVTVTGADYQAVGVRVTVDQSILGTSWNEIDAVELVGLASSDVAVTPDTNEEPAVAAEVPAGFLWRAGGESGIFEGEFAALGGMDTDAAGNLYIADNTHGIYVYDSAGNELNVIDHSDFNNTTDVKVGPDGNLYVADWAANSVFVVSPDGAVITSFGGEGTEPGLFGTFSPGALAVGPDGRVYVHDENEDAAGEDYERIQIFAPDGTFQSAFNIEEDFFALSGMDFGPDGNLYLVGFIGDGILQYDANGNLLGKLGVDALDFTGPQGLFIDNAGNFYVSTWSETPIIKLDPAGNLLATFGYEAEDDAAPWGEGGFYQAGGIAGLGDGSVIFVTDWSGDFAFITAFSYVE